MTIEQWSAIRNRDAAFDGVFVYAVKTTGVVCRPSCRGRTCNPENVIIFDMLEEAASHGFRPCWRCRPDLPAWRGAKTELAEAAKAFLQEHYQEKFSLDRLAANLYINKYYLARVFREVTGQTPLSFHHAVRCEMAKQLLTRQELSIAFISCEMGYQTAAHFTRIFRSVCGCTPSAYRRQYLDNLRQMP